jgi:CheY-like chemotaxis protein
MKRGRILVVDDDAQTVEILRRLLEREFEVDTASSGNECLAKLAEFRPQVVLLDVMMPGIDGHETCRRIKFSPLGDQIRVVLSSADATIHDKQRGAHDLADDFLVKPFEHEAMFGKVHAQFDAANHARRSEAAEDADSDDGLTPVQKARLARALGRLKTPVGAPG